MLKKINILRSSSFIRNVFILISGTAAAQVVTMVLSPIVTRMYGPEIFGVLGVFTSIIGILIPIAALTYPIAIVLPQKDEEAIRIVKISIISTLFTTSAIFLLLIVGGNKIEVIVSLKEYTYLIYFIPLIILISGFSEIIEQWLIRKKQFVVSSKIVFSQSVIVNTSKVLGGWLSPTIFTLIGVTILGFLVKFIMLLKSIKFEKKSHLFQNGSNKKDLKKTAKDYNDFPRYRAPEVFVNTISQSLPVIILSSLFGPASAGFYTIGKSILSLPSSLIGKSFGDVFYPKVNEAAVSNEQLAPLVLRGTMFLIVVGFIPYAVVFVYGPPLFTILFGEEWSMAGHYAKWIGLWSYFAFINIPAVRILPIISAQKFQLYYSLMMLFVRTLVLFSASYFFSNDLVAIKLFGISGAVLNAGLILITYMKCKKFDA